MCSLSKQVGSNWAVTTTANISPRYPDGLAAKAGISAGDRILSFNGTSVTHCSHNDVVDMLKKGEFSVCLYTASS